MTKHKHQHGRNLVGDTGDVSPVFAGRISLGRVSLGRVPRGTCPPCLPAAGSLGRVPRVCRPHFIAGRISFTFMNYGRQYIEDILYFALILFCSHTLSLPCFPMFVWTSFY